MRNKKIIVVHLLNDFSGSVRVLRQTLSALIQKGYDTKICTSDSKDGFISGLDADYFFIPYKYRSNKFISLLSYVFSQFYLFLKILTVDKRNTVLYINTLMPFGAALAGFVKGIPIVYHVHEGPRTIRPEILYKFLIFIMRKTSKKVIYVSKYLSNVTNTNVDSVIIYNSTNMPNDLNTEQNEEYNINLVCSLKCFKGVYNFIRLSTMFSNNLNVKFNLFLNTANMNEKDVSDFFKGFSLENVNLVLNESSKDKIYSDSYIVLNMSIPDVCVETFGMTILEAMSYGKPCIVPEVGGPTELVEHGLHGYRCSSSNLSSMYDYINLLIDDSKLYEMMSANAKQKARLFSNEIYNENIISLIDGI
tara:strand:+ start:6999 stop:8084 length:1086 start_codon:yes stop_codon:yes gene_type:complete